jgi:pyrrolysine biosynthesis protein PylC
MLADLFCKNVMPEVIDVKNEKPVLLEHVRAHSGRLESGGEHMMSEAEAVKCLDNFFGADEAVTDFHPGRNNWTATLIIKGDSPDDAWRKRSFVIKNITVSLNLTISEELNQEISFRSNGTRYTVEKR